MDHIAQAVGEPQQQPVVAESAHSRALLLQVQGTADLLMPVVNDRLAWIMLKMACVVWNHGVSVCPCVPHVCKRHDAQRHALLFSHNHTKSRV